MEARHLSATMGDVRALDVRRDALSVLSTGVMEPGSVSGEHFSLADGLGCLRLAGTECFRFFDVPVGAALVQPCGCDFRGGALCGESLSHGGCVLAKRAGGVAFGLLAAAVASLRASLRRGRAASDLATRRDRCCGMADECSGGGDGELLARVSAADHRYHAPQRPCADLR